MVDTYLISKDRTIPMESLKFLLPYILKYRKLVFGAIVFLLLAAITTLFLPLAVRRVIDYGFSGEDVSFINNYFTILMFFAVILAISSGMRYYFVILLGERVVSDLRRDVFTHLINLSPEFYDMNKSGEIISRLSADTTQIKSAVGVTTSMALRNSILCCGAVIMMFITSFKLSLFVIIGIPFVVIPLIGFGWALRRRSRHAQDALAHAMAYASEIISSTRTLQAFNAEKTSSNHFNDAIENSFHASKKSIKTRTLLTIVAISLVFSGIVGILWFGAHSVLEDQMSAGTLGQFLIYAILAAGGLSSLSEVWGEFSQTAGAAGRLDEILKEQSRIKNLKNPEIRSKPYRGAIEFQSVNFVYPSSPDKPVLRELSFVIKPGETVAIVGPSGAGKSTIFSLLMRFYDPVSGVIMIDDIDISKSELAQTRTLCTLVPQEITIFANSVAHNIAFSRPDATFSDIQKAAHSAYADMFVKNMNNGYNSLIGERGVTLSGGQRQRIAIARSLLKNAPILLLDEATSSLDAQSEKFVQQALDMMMKDRTTLVIAHRLSTILKADRILVMDKGKIIEEGDHQSLTSAGGVYANLVRLQFDQHK